MSVTIAEAGGVAASGGVRAIADRYDGFLLDQYGVLHDGERPLPGALECLLALRDAGKKLVVISNSPCERESMKLRLQKLGLSPALFDGLVTSGDLVRRHLDAKAKEAQGTRLRVAYICHADHDRRAVWSPQQLSDMGFDLVACVAEADFVLANGVEVCFKGTAAAVDSSFERDASSWGPIRPLLSEAADRGLELVVANPDRVIVRADGSVVNCPGLLADEYERLGGPRPRCFGKPGREIFVEARAILAAQGVKLVCHVGDSMHHDIGGAQAAGLPTLFVSGGIHASELAAGADLIELCIKYGASSPSHVLPFFEW